MTTEDRAELVKEIANQLNVSERDVDLVIWYYLRKLRNQIENGEIPCSIEGFGQFRKFTYKEADGKDWTGFAVVPGRTIEMVRFIPNEKEGK